MSMKRMYVPVSLTYTLPYNNPYPLPTKNSGAGGAGGGGPGRELAFYSVSSDGQVGDRPPYSYHYSLSFITSPFLLSHTFACNPITCRS